MSTLDIAALPTTGRWAIDPVHSTVVFSVRHHAVATFRASFTNIQGAYDADADRLDGEVAVRDVVVVGAERLRNHMQTPDFFDAEAHPTFRFTADGVRASADTGAVSGELTLKGRTQTIVAGASVPGGPRQIRHGDGRLSDRFGLDLATTIDRRDFGIDYNGFVAEGVYNLGWEVRVEASLELTRADDES
jgi:polyisoprenoid-binding protein YceI